MKYIAIMIFVLFMTSLDTGCLTGGGIDYQVDGVKHSFSWHSHGR